MCSKFSQKVLKFIICFLFFLSKSEILGSHNPEFFVIFLTWRSLCNYGNVVKKDAKIVREFSHVIPKWLIQTSWCMKDYNFIWVEVIYNNNNDSCGLLHHNMSDIYIYMSSLCRFTLLFKLFCMLWNVS